MKKWNLSETSEAVRDIAESNPHHIDPGAAQDACRYIGDDGKPQCIVGVFLVDKVGLPVDTVKELDTAAPFGGPIGIGHTVNSNILAHLDRDSVDFLSFVQGKQDMGYTWGRAVETVLSGH